VHAHTPAIRPLAPCGCTGRAAHGAPPEGEETDVFRKLFGIVLAAMVVGTGVAGAHAQRASATRSIHIVSAKAQSGGKILVTVKITGWKMYPKLVGSTSTPTRPNGGHWHIFVDGKYDNFSASPTTGTAIKVKAGKHTVYAELANNNHSSLKPAVKSNTVHVTVM
jgi:hypothetical protein